MQEAACLKVPKKLGEQAIHLVVELDIFNHELQIQQTKGSIYIPLVSEPTNDVLNTFKTKLCTFSVSVNKFAEREKHHLVPLDFLADKMPSNLLAMVPRAIDFVGNIAIVKISPELSAYKKEIGESILNAHKQTLTVLAQSGAIQGLYRLRDFEVIAGAKKTVTVYREYGYTYHVDVAKAYFSPRLSNEHDRVATQVTAGETVVDLFAGVGPFAIPIAKRHKNVKVYAVDINPDAVALLKQNIAVNRTENQVVPLLGDARQVVKEQLAGKADRVIMNLPETGLEFVDVACEAIKPEGGIVHYYGFVKDSKPLEAAKVQLTKAINKNKRKVTELLLVKSVREVAPYTWQVVVDAKIN